MKPNCLSVAQVLTLKKSLQILLDQLREDLHNEQVDQQDELSQITAHEVRDRGEAAGSTVTTLFNATHIAQLTNEIRECQHALKRIDEGDYGYCESCGEEIELNRLTANPMATLCISCQSREEIARNGGQAASF
ncbi:MAG: TraR/DksA family transcriptional regulator [Amphritea sp.]|nr:TraR/DksA family transcriptional regulator [Amphritea sp.]